MYRIYKLNFPMGVHFGKRSSDDSEFTVCADTLFSALCIEAAKAGKLSLLVKLVKDGALKISDLMPFIGNDYYLPKPLIPIKKETQGDSKVKKEFKKLKYISADKYATYIKGELDPAEENRKFSSLGSSFVKTSAAIRGLEESMPYRVGVYSFGENNGLYTIAEYNDDDTCSLLDDLFESLSYSGIGGRRSSGFGRFSLTVGKIPQSLEDLLTSKTGCYITVSSSLPTDEEIETVLSTGTPAYKVIRRTGFVFSETYANEFQRKNDMYVFASGSYFEYRYNGDIFDVSSFGTHPVYRYAIPMFLGV